MNRFLNRLRAEDGVAMVIVMGVMATMLILTSVVVSSSNLVGRNTNTDSARKRAFEAAEAGLQATLYRLNMLSPADNMCIGGANESVIAPSGAGASCASYTEDLGNGASYTSWTTATLSNGATCAGLQVGSSSSIAERCVTASGTVAGVTRRVQTRVASYAAAPIFPIAGIVGLHSITMTGTANIVGGEGSNGQISLTGNAAATNTTLGPSAPNVSTTGQANPGPITRRTAAQGPFQLGPVDPGNSATTNDNGRITNALAVPKGTPADSVTGNVTWNAATRTLSLTSKASVVLGGGIYNFCSISMSGQSTVALAAGARTAIYIDSPSRTGSGCAASSGTLSMSGGSSFINNSPPAQGSSFAHDPTALQLYVVGKAGATVTMTGNSAFYGLIYAPTSTVSLTGTADSYGAVAANDVSSTGNSAFWGDPNATQITTNSGGMYFRTAWRECLASAPNSNPGSGC